MLLRTRRLGPGVRLGRPIAGLRGRSESSATISHIPIQTVFATSPQETPNKAVTLHVRYLFVLMAGRFLAIRASLHLPVQLAKRVIPRLGNAGQPRRTKPWVPRRTPHCVWEIPATSGQARNTRPRKYTAAEA